MNERMIVSIVIALLAIIGGFVVCSEAFDDDDELRDSAPIPASADHRP